ncbi:formate hydrogenlyase [Rhodococcus triatomae]|uniref:Formate hydrogenlyase subunit 3/Multisubunit Na+/H+ antiporter, MnhD subunit n=1 Tax=Rhodococcus triatomae TaxID=300028 RepID=A0A1G8ACU5_9NOCA|nr:complex I subunit 5 family protein [Rhodococcus triatomae]QNG17802.1 formate hydrogenlyase [Rhodococcus triatomae]QNG22530.1 formate hydrogenlyase [Rhodococcus triatomae]SDH18697.1 Formate hydrogenlyase subunit 3/Multisubunit Na+/H+ antiporter, MnhD subunit [Rhodococcus triatomae]
MNASWSTVLWASSVFVPLGFVFALCLLAPSRRPRAVYAKIQLVRTAPLAVIPTAALALLGPDRVGPFELPWMLLGTHFAMDVLGRPLLFVTALLYGAAMIAVYSSGTTRTATLTGFLLIGFVGNAGVFVAADAITFYLSFAVMSLSAYGLVIHERTAAARRAGRVYVVLTMISEVAVLAAVVLTVHAGGLLLADAPSAVAHSDQRSLIIALLVVGFGVKAGTFPLHVWLPLAHPAAPPPGSAVLSGTMIKAGLMGWLRFLPLGEVALPGWGLGIVVVALIGAFLALPPGLLQNDAKVALAYSSISQMGFLAVLVGTALATPELTEACTLAAVVYAVHHGMAKGGLFLGVTVWRTHGEGWVRWWVLIGLGLLALAVAGAPLGSGAVAKYAAKEAISTSTVLGIGLAELLPLVGTVSTLLLARAGWLLITGSRDRAWGVDGAIVSWSVLIVGGTVFTWYLAGQWASVLSVPGLDAVTFWDATWPILLGIGLAAAGWWLSSRDFLPAWLAHPDGRILPPGDLVVPEEAMARRLGRTLERGADALSHANARATRSAVSVAERLPFSAGDAAETRLSRWVASGVAVLAVTTLVAVVILVGAS